ncbi:MAG: outer membrane protein assembly factor BamA, partial [Acidobacteriota bacterium]
ELVLTGPLNNPDINGTGEINDGFFQLSTFAITASNVRGRIEFSGHTVTLSSLQGVVNGGPFNVQGDLQYQQFNIKSAALRLSASNVQLNYPEGLLSQSDINMSLEGEGKSWLLSGEVKLLQALYRKDVYPGSQLMSAMVSRRPLTRGKRPEALQNVKLDIRFDTVGSIIVDNNMASLELYGDLRITGTALRPIVTGRISMRYTGEVVFAEHRYQIERAVIDFLGTEQLDPNLDIAARTKMKHKYDELDIQLALSGPLSNLTYSLSSSPPRSEEEIASLLITGRSLDEVKSESANIIGEQMLFYFASPIASPLTKQLQKVLGIEEVTIEPINIATEEDPGARFTFTKRMSDDVSVTYSVDVSNSQQQTWLLDYNLGRNFSIRSFRKDDGSYGSSFRHRFTFGSQRPSLPKAAEEQRVQQFIKGVEIEGDVRLPRQSVIKKIKPLKVGSPFDYGKLRTVIENLIAFYKSTGYINAVITPTIKYENDGDVYIVISILPQKPGSILYEGDSIPKKLKKSIVSSWDGRLFEDTALMESVKLILNHLRSKGFYDAEVRAEKKVEANRTRYNFHIRKGGQYRIRKFTVMGNKFIDSNTIEKLIKRLPLPGNWGLWILIYDFEQAKEAIESLYEDNGFLKAAVSSPRIEVDSEHHSVDIGLTIDEGPQSLVNSVEFSGNTVFTNEELIKGLKLVKDSIFRPSLLTDERNHLFNLYRTKGYQEIEIAVEVVSYSNSPNVNILYTIKEGVQHYIAEIQIVGNKRTPHTMILRELKFKKGDVLTLANLSLSKKRLYDMGIFESVHIYPQPLAEEIGQDRVIVEIREKANFAVTYGLRYNSELKLEGIGELGIYNIFGRARNGVVYYRQNELEKDLRFSLKEPYLFGKRLNTIYSFYYNEMLKATFVIDEIGFSVQQQHQLPHHFSFSYLYSLHKIHTYELEPSEPYIFDISLFLSKLSTFLVRDTRDKKMDSQQGSFFSVSFTYSPEFLGSDLTFISMFGQVSFYQPLLSNVVWASNYRVGLADAFDQVLIPSERFFTGGGNSIRGFERDMVGPLNPYDLTAEGGEALFIMNQELRFPIHKWLRGVAFYDMGNVYSSLSDLNPFDARHSIGFGLRLDTRFSLIRVDYGINLFPRPGEPRGVFFFSIGQAF